MGLLEGLIVACVECLGTGMALPFGDQTIDFTPPWQRHPYAQLFQEHVGVAMDDTEGVRAQAVAARIPLEVKTPVAHAPGSPMNVLKDHDVLVHELFEHKVEDKLTGPVFVYDYPAKLCPLTKRKAGQPHLAERFELYVHGMELANAYTELNDPLLQESLFQQQLAGQKEEDSMARMDDDFIRALKHAMPPAGGLGIGIDRLCMLLMNQASIRDVILFPLLRPQVATQP